MRTNPSLTVPDYSSSHNPQMRMICWLYSLRLLRVRCLRRTVLVDSAPGRGGGGEERGPRVLSSFTRSTQLDQDDVTASNITPGVGVAIVSSGRQKG